MRWIAIICFMVVATVQPLAKAQVFSEDSETIRWSNDYTEVIVRKDGGLAGVIDKKTGTNILGTGLSRLFVTTGQSRLKRLVEGIYDWEVEGNTLKVRAMAGPVVVEERFTLRPDVERAWVERQVLLDSDTDEIVRGVQMFVNIEGHAGPRWQYLNMVVHGPLATVYWGFIDYGRYQVGGSREFSHEAQVVGKLGPDYEPVLVGTQYLYSTEGKGAEAIHDFYRITRFAPPEDTPEWLRGSVMYSGHPGGRIESLFADVGGFDAMREQLPYLNDLGIDVIWLLPIFQFNQPPHRSFEIPYGVYDFYAIEEVLGGEEAARAYVDAAHDLDMKVIIDTVPHGGWTPLFHDHPEWLTYDEKMQPHAIFGWGADYSQPGWQAVMQDVAGLWAQRLDVDGYRIDLGSPDEPSWDLDRPSAATLGGGVGMSRAIRDGIRSVKDKPFIYSEMLTGVGTGEIEHTPYVDANYGWAFFNRINELWSGRVSTRGWTGTLKRQLHDEYLAFPPGYHFVRFLTNHDMTRDYGRPLVRFGPGMATALMSLSAFIDGIPFVYQGQEIGLGESFKEIFRIRKSVPQLQHGTPLYNATSASPGVFSFARYSEEGYAVPVINLNEFPVDAEIDVSDLKLGDGVFAQEVMRDQWFSMQDGKVIVPLEAFGAGVLRFSREESGHASIDSGPVPRAAGDDDLPRTLLLEDHTIVWSDIRMTMSEWGWPRSVQVGDGVVVLDGPTLVIGELPVADLNGLSYFAPINRPARVVSPAEYHLSPDGTRVVATSEVMWGDRRQEVPMTLNVTYYIDGDGIAIDVEMTLQAELTLRLGLVEVYWGIPDATTWAVNSKYGLYHDSFHQLSPNWLGSRAYGWEIDEIWGGRFVPYRLWTSAMHPLHGQAPFVALMADDTSLAMMFREGSADLFITDGSDLRKPYPYFHVSWLDPLRPIMPGSSQPAVSRGRGTTVFPAGHKFSFAMTLTPGEGGLAEIKRWAGGPFSYHLPEVRR